MNFELVLKTIMSALVFACSILYSAKTVLNEKINFKDPINIIAFIFYTFFLIINAFISDKFLKSVSGCAILIVLYKIIFRKDWNRSTVLGLIMFILILVSEFFIGSILSILSTLINFNIVAVIQGTVLLNVIVVTPILLISYFQNKQLKRIINYVEYKGEKLLIGIFAIVIVIFSILLSRYDIRNWLFNFEFYINIFIFLIVFVIFIIILKQNNDHNKFISKSGENNKS